MVYYRKYRPQTISELDLASVREKLSAILSSKDFPHAFLFTGSKGLGKTSAARILAKAINCEKRNYEARSKNYEEKKIKKNNHDSKFMIHDSIFEPCNKCEACVSITNGSNIDVLEIDAASNGGVEEIRTLRERVKFASSMLRKKVYIIDEVHMLSPGAFNALLKTLEEPPSHVVFILATTELHKLPATVISRTFQIRFEKPTIAQMVESLKRIVKGEKLEVDPQVLEKIAQISDGAFRDAAKNLEELMLNSRGKKLTTDLFDTTFQTSGLDANVIELLKAYENHDAKKGLETIAALNAGGADFKIVIEKMVDYLRGLLMMRNGIESQKQDILGLRLVDIQELLQLANEAYGEMKISVIPQLPLELMTVRYCILDREKGTEKRGEEARVEQVQKPVIKSAEYRQEHIEPIKSGSTVKDQQSSTNQEQNFLPRLILDLNLVNKPGAALLRSAKNAVIDNELFIITTPFPIHAERLLSDKVLPDLQKAVENIVGKKIELKITISH